MQKSARFIAAVVLLASALFLQISKMTKKDDISVLEAETSANQDFPTETQTTVRNDVRKDEIPTTETTAVKETEPSVETEIVEYDASVPYISESKMRELNRKMEEVSKYSTDLVGWIYIADSDIDYPVVQGTDNQYYLHRTPDGRRNDLGTIFLDCKCSSDFSDSQNILFGHNMQYGMFGGTFIDNPKFPELNQALFEIAARENASKAAVAIAWILRHPAKMQAIIGTMNPEHIRDICAACDVTISHHDWYALYLASGKFLP